MGYFKRKQAVVEARQYIGLQTGRINEAVAFDDWLCAVQPEGHPCRYVGHKLILPTIHGGDDVNPGDWVVLGEDGFLHAVRGDQFEDLFERTDEPQIEDMPADERTVAQQAVDTLRSITI
jgi:hypothetical protein